MLICRECHYQVSETDIVTGEICPDCGAEALYNTGDDEEKDNG